MGVHMIDRDVAFDKLRNLKLYVDELKLLSQAPYEEYVSSLAKQWEICHGLQIAIQLVIDIGNHILAGLNENGIEEYVDIIDKIGEKGIIPSDFAARIRPMVGLRNILVHEYARIDIEKVYDVIRNNLNDFTRFDGYIRTFLAKKE
jgi:uncharacterized protein YutE (UPF0331/DUF86 family)